MTKDLNAMNVSSTRDNKPRKNDEETKQKSGGKSVRFSRQMISDIYFIERVSKQHAKELFYSEKDIIGFQIDAIKKGQRKQRRNRERQVIRSNSDGKVETSSRRDSEELDDSSSEQKKSRKSTKKRSKDVGASRRYSNDDAPDYEQRTASDESRKKESKDELTEKRKARKKSSSKRRESDSSSSSSGSSSKKKISDMSETPRKALTQEQLLEKAMLWRQTAKYKEDSDKLDSTASGSNISLEPWTQDMLMTKAKQWHETVASKVAASTPEKKPAKTSETTKSMALHLIRDAKESISSDKLKKEPPPEEKGEKKMSKTTKQVAFMLARDAKEATSSATLEEPKSDDDESIELTDLVEREKATASKIAMSQDELLAQATEKRKEKEEAESAFGMLRGIARSTMVSQTFQKMTMEKSTQP